MTYYDIYYNPMDRAVYAYKDVFDGSNPMSFDRISSRKWLIETLGM